MNLHEVCLIYKGKKHVKLERNRVFACLDFHHIE